jgi:hypothetical protein
MSHVFAWIGLVAARTEDGAAQLSATQATTESADREMDLIVFMPPLKTMRRRILEGEP